MAEVVIRLLTTHDELRACEDIQRAAWNMIERDIVPMHLLVAVNLHGGLVLGAEVDGALAGFLFGYPGWLEPDDPRRVESGEAFFHASQMMGVLPAYQNHGLGYLMKQKQRELVLAQGMRLAMWTFDPLQSRNAYFNLVRLGAVTRRYIRNLYDELPGVNAGMPTDRLEMEWWLGSERAARQLGEGKQPPQRWQVDPQDVVCGSERRGDGLRAPAEGFSVPDAARFCVEIPGDIDRIKAADMGLARAWRFHTREVFEAAFAAGYMVTGFVSEVEEGERRGWYVLTRGDAAHELHE